MIRLSNELALKIEEDALESLVQYKSEWSALNDKILVAKKEDNLAWISTWANPTKVEVVDAPVSGDFHRILVELAVIQHLLTDKSALR